MLPKVPLLQLDDYKLQQVQANIVNFLNQLGDVKILGGNLVEGVALSSAQTTSVQHKLKRAYIGYIITKQDTNAAFWVGATTESDIYLKLNSSANCTVDIWVF